MPVSLISTLSTAPESSEASVISISSFIMTFCGPGEKVGAACCSTFVSRLPILALSFLVFFFFDRRSALSEELFWILEFRSLEGGPADCEDCEEREDCEESDDCDEREEREDSENLEQDEEEDRKVDEHSDSEGGGVGRNALCWSLIRISLSKDKMCSERACACSCVDFSSCFAASASFCSDSISRERATSA